MKASDLFLRALEEEGVDTIFGVPGEENADMMISLIDSPIRFIMTRHEQGAAFMADVHGRLTGQPGVCLGTLGPGATNLVTGVANGNFDRSPVVAITGQGSTARLHKESHQNMDVVAMFRPITKWADSVRNPGNIPEMVHKAFRRATTEKPGACHIELPEDIAKMDVDAQPIPKGKYKLRRPAPDHKSIAQAIDILREAKTPVILAGNGCIRKRASKQLRLFVQNTGIMCAQTFMAKGALDFEDPANLLVAGLGSRDHVSAAFEQADVVIAIGYDLIEWHPSNWNRGIEKKIIHIDFEPAEVDAKYMCDVEIVSDVAAALWELNQQLENTLQFQNEVFAHLRAHMLHEMGFAHLCDMEHPDADSEAAAKPYDDSFPMKPQRILRDLRDMLNRDDILISDVGAHKMWVARQYPAYEPNTCLISNGFCSMGIAVPGAIAAKMAMPDKKVVGLCGDGGFMMNVQELATAVQYKVPAVFLIWEDSGFGLIEWKQTNQFHRTSNVHFENPELRALGEAFGVRSFEVTSAADFKIQMAKALAITDGPSLVVVKVDYSENVKLTQRLGRLLAR
ncbi:MAG: acetolactate synthase large subunit [Deltaproteobacteria bacterium]|nr:acetolactate synthase large subunit [Deltaproteobacteria bacterium]